MARALPVPADKGHVSAALDRFLGQYGAQLLHPSYPTSTPHPEKGLFKFVRRPIESDNDTLKRQLGPEQHTGHAIEGTGARIGQHTPATTHTIRHHHTTNRP
ncbi:hypothetical protein [Kitasatospora cineracea]|uniref:hypothetical protein n=1 Tax=Kitasatospora cineracea TaxID=88074 RepID=UPI0037F15483